MDIEILEEKALSMAELKSKLEDVKKRDKELNFRANKAYEYLEGFNTLEIKKAREIEKKINDLGIARLKDKHIAKIMDLMPKNMDLLKAIFAGENVTLKQEDLAKILEVLS